MSVRGRGRDGRARRLGLVTAVVAAMVGAVAPQAAASEDLDAGAGQTCAIRSTGAVACWGGGPPATSSPPARAIAVSAGASHACAVRPDGDPVCWGDDGAGRVTGIPGDLEPVAAVSAGGDHSCALETAGTTRCWGDDSTGEASPPAGLGAVREIAAGNDFTCAVKANLTVACWGDPATGAPTVPSGLGAVREISAGGEQVCAVELDGTVECWGQVAGAVPLDLTSVVALSVGEDDACAVQVEGTVACWGGDVAGAGEVPADLGLARAVAVGQEHACAQVADGTVRCWGSNENGRRDVPSHLGTVGRLQLSAAEHSSCAVKPDGLVGCWGLAGIEEHSLHPPSGLGAVRALDMSGPCAVRLSGTVDCWGNGAPDTSLPDDLGAVRSVSGAGTVACAIKADGTVACWGDSSNTGRLPVPSDLGPVRDVVVAPANVCAVTAAGAVRCWGVNWFGTVSGASGVGTVRSLETGPGSFHMCAVQTDGDPVCWGGFGVAAAPAGTGAVRNVQTGDSHVCAVKADGTTACWGDDGNGRVSGVPTGWTASISAGRFHACAVAVGGTVACWGKDDFGQASPPVPASSQRPSLAAAAWAAGETATATPGTWSAGADVTSVWMRCPDTGTVGCTPISGSESLAQLVLTADDEGKRLRLLETATTWAGTATRWSPPGPVVGAPVNTRRPALTGALRTGAVLTVDLGAWTFANDYEVTWLRCTSLVIADCTAIAEAGSSSDLAYTLTDADDAMHVRARVVAVNSVASSRPAYSGPTAKVDRPTLLTRPALTLAGSVVTTGRGVWTGDPTSHTVRWLRCTSTALSSCTELTTADATDDDTSYTLTPADASTRLRSAVRARNAAGDSTRVISGPLQIASGS